MDNIQEQCQSDEINLRELFATLWGNKILIIAITALFSITGIIYAFFAPQVWRAKTIVTAPETSQLKQLQFRLENLIALLYITKNNSINNKNLTFNTANSDFQTVLFEKFSEKKLFTDFIQSFDSFDNKRKFLKENGYLLQDDIQDGISQQRSLERRAKNISSNQMMNEEFATLSFGGENAQEALKLLNEYLNFIQNKEILTKNKLLADIIANQISTLDLAYQLQQSETLKRLQEDIARTEFALRISRTAGIETPVENLNNQNIFTIDLGAKALSEKLSILKEIKDPVLINPALADIRLQLYSLQAVPQDQVNFTSYHYLQSPLEPLDRDKPKRSLVVVLATMAGLMVGVMVALFRASWVRRD